MKGECNMPAKTENYKLNQWKKEDDFLMKDFNADNAALEAALTDLQSAVDSKAAQSEVDTLKTTVSTKANQSDLTSLTSTVNTKAAQSELNTLKNTVNTKANQSDLTSLTTTVNGKVGIVVGTYAGNNAETRDIALGFQPKLVLLMTSNGVMGNNSAMRGGMALPGQPLHIGSEPGMEITSNGFRVTYNEASMRTNEKQYTYIYLAVV